MIERLGLGDVGYQNASTFSGTWEDLQGPVSQGTGNASLTFEQYRDAPFKCYFLRHDQDDELNYVFQMRHKWMRGTSVNLHLHYTGMSTWVAADLTKDGYFQIKYNWVAHGAEVPAASGWTTVYKTVSIAKADIYKDAVVSLCTIAPGANAKESSILRVQIIRLGTSPSDTYNDNKTVGTTGAANIAIWDMPV
jgi:hypothetical protein